MSNPPAKSQQLKRNVPYRVLSKNTGRWLTSSSTLPGFYDKSAIYLQDSEKGTDQLATFAFDSLRHRSVSAIEEGDLAFIRMFDSSGRSLGGLTDISSNNGKVSGAIGTKGTSDKLTFAVKYV